MPGTRNRTGSNVKNDNSQSTGAEQNVNHDGPQSKRKRQNRVEKEALADRPATPPPESPLKDKKRKVEGAKGDVSSPIVNVAPETDAMRSSEKLQGKRGRPLKSERPELMKSEDKDGGMSSVTATSDGDESGSRSTASTQEQANSIFSPRRSSRGVVPNRRFQDMELDLAAMGRKRSKEDSADSPKQKHPKMATKKEQVNKNNKSSGQSGVTKPVGTTDGETKTGHAVTSVLRTATVQHKPLPCHTATVAQTSDALKSPVVSISSVLKTSTSKKAQQMLMSTGLSPGKSSGSTSQENVSPPEPSSEQSKSAHSETFPSSPGTTSQHLCSQVAPSISSSSQNSQGLLLSQASDCLTDTLSTSTISSSSMNRTVSITSSCALLAQAGSGTKDVTEKSVPPAQTVVESVVVGSDTEHTQLVSSVETVSSQMEVVTSDLPDLTDLAEGSVVEVSIVPGQQGTRSPRVVSISPSINPINADRGKTAVETPGRVMGKSESSTKSKSVYIVRNPPSQTLSAASKPFLLPSVLPGTPAGKVATVTKEAGVGDVMSIVEVAPNKKVPVVLAERKEQSSKLVKVISAQQISQLSPALQKIVSSHMQQQPSSTEGSSQSAEGSTQQSKRTVTVHVAAPAQSLSELVFSAPSDDSASRPDQPTDDSPIDAAQSVAVQEQQCKKEAESVPPDMSSDHSQSASAQGLEQVPSSAASSTVVNVESGEKSDAAGTSGSSQSRTSGGLATKVFNSLFSDEDEGSDENEDDNAEEEEGIPVSGKYVTSGTQTPYSKSSTRKVITVHVHPPSKEGEKNTEVVTVTKVEKDDSSDDIADGDDSEMAPDDKGKYIVVDLPEGTTVKQQHVRSSERVDSDPNFYTVDEKGLFICHICNYQTYRRPNFYKHKKKHLGLRPYSCDKCHYRAATSSNLKRHQEIHKDIRNHRCPICNLNFRQKIHLERHIKYKHEEKKVKCPLCDYVCANENPDLKVHIKRRHMPQLGSQEAMNAFKCPECGVIANSKRDLRQHLKFHSKGPELKLFCNMCSFVTDCESRLRRHQYIHTKEKPFQCGLCDYRGSQKEHVLRHMRTQHNIEIERKHRAKKELERGTDKEGQKAADRVDYTSDEKIFACNHCEMKFSKLLNLYKHLHTQHRDIMPPQQEDFSCVVCDFRTSTKKNLLVHMRRHTVTDQSPPSHVYSCVLCRYLNPKRRNLFQHMRKKHHIEIVVHGDGSTSCYAEDLIGIPASITGVGSSQALTPHTAASAVDSVVNVLPLSDLISPVTQSSDLQATDTSTVTVSSSTMPAAIKMEDLALVVSNPLNSQGSSREGAATLVDARTVETFTIGAFSQDAAAEAIQGLQALAQRGVLETGTIVEEQVQVMGSDDQATLVIDPSLGVVEQLVQPKTEPMHVVEIENQQLLDQVTPGPVLSKQEEGVLLGSSTVNTTGQEGTGANTGLQLSAEQLLNLSTGDLLEINGEMFRVDVSTGGDGGPQVISLEPTIAQQADGQDSLVQPVVNLENVELS